MNRRLQLASITLLLAACGQKVPALNNLSCSAGKCLAGYTCDPGSNLCIETPAVGCSKGQLCPTSVQTGGACTITGEQLPCDLASTCPSATGNCRTCVSYSWGPCSGGGSSSGGGSGSSSSGGPTGQPGAVYAVTSGGKQGGVATAAGLADWAFAIGTPVAGPYTTPYQSSNSSNRLTCGFFVAEQP